jgi:aerobic-type carbon monoxide dehydrogenase small subunit (CoxS/CutS family)
MEITINGRRYDYDGDPDQPLLWILRDTLGLTGTKYACGIGECGACIVLVDGRARRSCETRARQLAGREVVTIEGLSPGGEHPVQRAWVEEDVPQCGYCQAGQIMAVVDLLGQVPHPTDADIDRLLPNICRCGTYFRIRRAIHRAARYLAQES